MKNKTPLEEYEDLTKQLYDAEIHVSKMRNDVHNFINDNYGYKIDFYHTAGMGRTTTLQEEFNNELKSKKTFGEYYFSTMIHTYVKDFWIDLDFEKFKEFSFLFNSTIRNKYLKIEFTIKDTSPVSFEIYCFGRTTRLSKEEFYKLRSLESRDNLLQLIINGDEELVKLLLNNKEL